MDWGRLVWMGASQRSDDSYCKVMSSMSKKQIVTRVITDRVSRTLDENQPREQASFRKGYSTIDLLQTLNQLVEKAAEYNIPHALAFLDYKKAYDSVENAPVTTALKQQGINPVYINTLQHIYNNCRSFIRLHKDSEPFQLEKGVCQVFRNLDWEARGIKIDAEYLSHLRLADDILLIANSLEESQEIIIELNDASKTVGLHMNFKKTQVMINEKLDEDIEIKVENETIQQVDLYIYLGQRISVTPSKEEGIKRRIKLGWQAFG
ncbi:PREDICTED: uncharacterized protein LOC106816711 [Priapulus caudatus]|uniref:Uncharacterized protein LOC106816711 n=1 Tax=Priapulus caudatus TaxID=37621 RepID=A0ABM1EX96_PRICU|nr:PREDICTED: uncharacterized protein LOC106816711 [Priapulus caudatus]